MSGEFAPVKGEPPVVRWEPCAVLQADPAYQREIDSKASQRLIRHIAENWDWRLCAPLTVSHRADTDGTMAYFVIDGQHRLAAAELRQDIDELPCIISKFASFEEEALAFVAINTARKGVTALDKYHARVAAKEELALAIKATVSGSGLTVTRSNDAASWQKLEIAFPDAVGRALERDPLTTCRALEVLAQAYPSAPLLRGSDLFEGLLVVMRSRGKPWVPSDVECFARHIGLTLQSAWVSRRDKKKAEDDTWTAGGAMAHVMLDGYRGSGQAPNAATPIRTQPQPVRLEDATANFRAMQSGDGKTWCDQCEKLVASAYAKACISPFCKAKAAA